jgi:ssDNA-binding Zn-finger/Zn-ribbon topoisomerase 1
MSKQNLIEVRNLFQSLLDNYQVMDTSMVTFKTAMVQLESIIEAPEAPPVTVQQPVVGTADVIAGVLAGLGGLGVTVGEAVLADITPTMTAMANTLAALTDRVIALTPPPAISLRCWRRPPSRSRPHRPCWPPPVPAPQQLKPFRNRRAWLTRPGRATQGRRLTGRRRRSSTMASKLLGRCDCPECDFKSAHVKINTDKETAKAYRHCPECGAQYFPRNQAQADSLLSKMREEGAAPAVSPAVPVPDLAPPPPPSYKVVLGVRVPA